MRYQNRHFMCGPTALANALEVYGKRVNQDEIAKVAGTTVEGTSLSQIKKAAKKYGFYGIPVKYKTEFDAEQVLVDNLYFPSPGHPIILCVDKWTHWITAIGTIGSKYIVVDGADDEYIRFYNSDELLLRWRFNAKYYGLIISDEEPGVPLD